MLYNLLNQPAILKRDATERLKNKEANREAALKFGQEYFDGTREQGYGGYYNDGRWKAVAQRIRARYYGYIKTEPKEYRFLDIGCAKGFLVKEMQDLGFCAYGIDISKYAIEHCEPSIKEDLFIGDCRVTRTADHGVDASVSINVIHNLDQQGCKDAIREMMRITHVPTSMFIQVDAYENDRTAFDDWNLTAKTCLRPTEWVEIFKEVGYEGDYFFTIVG